ncbi:MAG: dihydroxy-acid dehydratase, partial [Alicyclobacillus shizuokensis]|nr:dihydroxy-acid dehydratase [Alicyclobacillus shizuokensis]
MDNPVNPYTWNVQGKANEPITVAGLLDKARFILGAEAADIPVTWTLDEIYTRLEENAPRIAIIGGSWDHPAHVMDLWTVARSALSLWTQGAVPFYAAIPVLCDGTAQNTMGMSYSLQSRQAIAAMVVNHLEAQSYHGAFVIQSCDKQPFGVLCGLAHLDVIRRRRGEAPVMATFAPVHVLRGGTIPEKLRAELEDVAERAETMGLSDIAHDLRDAMAYILQCSSNTAFQGVLTRAVREGVITHAQHKLYEQVLAVNTCDPAGGICAFHGTGNSSRDAMAGLGLVHPAVELLTAPPTRAQVDDCVSALLAVINKPQFSVSQLIRANIRNAIRIHSAAGGSTNLMMHIVAAMVYAGQPYSLYDVERVCQEHPIPDLFDYSLTEGRDIYALALQCGAGYSRGMETLIHELVEHGVPMDLDAPTITGATWRERLQDKTGLAASNVRDNPIILSTPRRPFSGVDVLRSNFFTSAVVKISGMPTAQLDEFDERLRRARALPREVIDAMLHRSKNARPMDVLISSVSMLADYDPMDESKPANLERSINLIAKLPTIVATWNAIRSSKPIPEPNPDLSHAANTLYMLLDSMPDREISRMFDVCLILHAEHSFNASTFAARQVASTRAHMYACICAAIAALSGDLHGGANVAVMKNLLEIGDESKVEDWVNARLDAGEKIMGLGHAVY